MKPAGLADPDELIAYVGIAPREYVSAEQSRTGVSGFGGTGSQPSPWSPLVWGALLMLVGVPLVLALSAVVRFHSTISEPTIARLHLLGLSRWRSAVAVSVPIALVSVVGAAVGLLAYTLVTKQVTQVPFLPGSFFPRDVAVSVGRTLLVLAALPGLVLVLAAGRPSAVGISVRSRESRARRQSPLVLVLPVIGLTLLAVVAVAPGDKLASTNWSLAFLAGALFFCLGLPVSLPWLCSRLGRTLTSARWPSFFLATRRLARFPIGSARVVGIYAAVFFAIVAISPTMAEALSPGQMIEEQLASVSTLPVQVSQLPRTYSIGELDQVPGVQSASRVYVARGSRGIDGVVPLTCSQFREILPEIERCPSSPVRISDSPVLAAGTTSPSERSQQVWVGKGRSLLQRDEVAVSELISGAMSGLLLVRSSQLDVSRAVPESRAIVLVKATPFPPDATAPLSAGLMASAPTAQVQSSALAAYWGLQAAAPVRLWVIGGAVFVGLVSLFAILISGLSSWTLRRGYFAGTLAVGAQPKVLRKSFAIELLIALLAAMVLTFAGSWLVIRSNSIVTGAGAPSSLEFFRLLGLGLLGGVFIVLLTAALAPIRFSVTDLKGD
ncbi:MAG: hypothetical protein ABI720_09920 [Actinomycetes bacterium]